MMKTILVADDEGSIRDLLKRLLESEGYNVLLAENGKQALNSTQENRPDLIILDLIMPEINGLDVCRQIRQNAETAGIPIIMLTAKGAILDQTLGYHLGADDYVVKPFIWEELKSRIGNLI
ncbi:MAG: response regulator [Elusimicrobia bacterium]|nr:response regulator [Elusimicrobiota bacterium]